MILQQTPTPPLFQVIPQRITSTDKQATTKAYTIHCQKDDASQLSHLLTHGPFRNATNQIFVPFRYKSKKPELFVQCIRQQNEMYHKTWIIKVEGLTESMMQTIQPEIIAIKGVMQVLPTKRLSELGEWKLLVEQPKCSFIHRQLSNLWNSIIEKIPESMREQAPSTFSVPMISSKRAREYQDNDSDDDSYGSLLSTGTTVSMMSSDDVPFNDLPAAYKYPSYAAAATNSSKSVDDTQVSSPTTSTYTGWHQEKHDLERQIRNQATQIEKIQADLQAKINQSKDLEDQLAQAIELAHSRDARLEEMMTRFEQLMHLQAGSTLGRNPPRNDDNDNESNPATPERLQATGPPLPKSPIKMRLPIGIYIPSFGNNNNATSPPIQGNNMRRR